MEPPAEEDPRADLEAILQTSLEFGVRVQMSGGYTARVRDSMQRVALGMGAERAETWVSSGSIGLAVLREGWSRTSVRTTPAIGVNFTELSELSQLARSADGLTVEEVRERLEEIESHQRRYPHNLVLVMLGVSCAAFAGLFGCDAAGIVLAGIGGFAGAWVRSQLLKRRFKPFIYCFFSALVSVFIVLGVHRLTGLSDTIDPAATASILYLVPGVPLLNGTADLLTSNYLNGVVRLTRASVILLGAALGYTSGFFIWGH